MIYFQCNKQSQKYLLYLQVLILGCLQPQQSSPVNPLCSLRGENKGK